MKITELTDALVELGPSLDPVNISESQDGMTFSVIFEDDTRVLIERDEIRETLVFIGTLGLARSDEEMDRLCRFLMQFNSIWSATGGLRFACETDGEFSVLYDLPYGPLDTNGLGDMLSGFSERTRYWKDIVGRGAPNPDSQPHDGEVPENMIRV